MSAVQAYLTAARRARQGGPDCSRERRAAYDLYAVLRGCAREGTLMALAQWVDDGHAVDSRGVSWLAARLVRQSRALARVVR